VPLRILPHRGKLFFAPVLFKQAVKGADSQMGAIIRELTHLVGIGDKPKIYGTKLAKALAVGVAAKAKNRQFFVV